MWRARRHSRWRFSILGDGARPRLLPALLPSAAATAVAVSAATAAGAILFGAGFVHIERPSIHVTAIERGNGSLALAIVAHFHESKPAGTSRVAVGNEVHPVNGAKLLKHTANGAFRCVEAKVTYENILQLILLSEICRTANAGRKA